MRTFLGFLIAAVALAAAVYLHSGVKLREYTYGARSTGYFGNTEYVKATGHKRATWQDPLAVLIAVAGVGAGVGIVRRV